MPLVLTELRREYPGVSLRLETGDWQQLCERLLAEDLEFFVAHVGDLAPDPRIAITPIGRQRAYLFARPGHPLAGRPCTIAQAWKYGVASVKWPAPLPAQLALLMDKPAGEGLVLALECNDTGLLRTLAAQTDTVIGGSDASYRAALDAGELVRLDVTDLPPVHSEMGIVALANRTPSPMASRAIGCVQSVAAEVNERPS